MKPLLAVPRALPAAVALALGAVLTLPTGSSAFTLNGGSLDVDARTFRVFDNFTDPTASDNQTPHPEFPGAVGATQAIWKAFVEWGSELHGTGAGDPSQPGDLGSGGANLDMSYQGPADGPGGVSDNVVSASQVPLGAVVALVESGPAGGWRMRLGDADFVFDDGPGTSVTGVDLQGVVTRTLGTLLGLGPSAVSGATMSPFVGAVQARSIEADDRAGLQAIYGAAAPTKPRIDGVSIAGSTITITGASFAPTDGELRFTGADPASGEAVVVTGVPSTAAGTQISATLPAGIASGDVLVHAGGSGGAAISNAWPYDITAVPAPAIALASPVTVPVLGVPPPSTLLIGSNLGGVTVVRVGGVEVAGGTPFDGEILLQSDGGLFVELPVVGAGLQTVEVVGAGGSSSTLLELLPAAEPVLAIDQPTVEPAGLDVAVAAQPADVVFLLVSAVPGPTVVPGVLDLELGGGSLAAVFSVRTLVIGPEAVRVASFGPFGSLATGATVGFEALVLEASTGYGLPFASTNLVERTIGG